MNLPLLTVLAHHTHTYTLITHTPSLLLRSGTLHVGDHLLSIDSSYLMDGWTIQEAHGLLSQSDINVRLDEIMWYDNFLRNRHLLPRTMINKIVTVQSVLYLVWLVVVVVVYVDLVNVFVLWVMYSCEFCWSHLYLRCDQRGVRCDEWSIDSSNEVWGVMSGLSQCMYLHYHKHQLFFSSSSSSTSSSVPSPTSYYC